MRTPERHTQAILDKVKQAIESTYAVIEGRKHTLHIGSISFGPVPDSDNYTEQHNIIAKGDSVGVDFYADVQLLDNANKKVLDSKNHMRLGKLPIVTNRHSFIIKGKEYIVHNQVRLRPAIYTKFDRNDNAVADLNLAKGSNMSIMYVPHKKQFELEVNSNHVPLYTLLKDVYNVPDHTLSNNLGSDIHNAEMAKHVLDKGKNLPKLFNAIHKNYSNIVMPSTNHEIAQQIRTVLDRTVMEPEVNEMTLGKPYNKVTPEALMHTASEVMNVYKGKTDPTWKDNLAFKKVMGTEDFLFEKFTKRGPLMKATMKPKIDANNTIKGLMLPYYFAGLLDEFFVHSDLVNYPLQVNPMKCLRMPIRLQP